MKRIKFLGLISLVCGLFSQASFAGYDYMGPIQKIWSKPEGIYLQVSGVPATYCQVGYGITLL